MGTAALGLRLRHSRADGGGGGCCAKQFLIELVAIRSVADSTPPPPSQADDPISLKTQAKAGAELYVAVARLYVESGKFTEAEEQYQQAMKKFPNDIRVLLGYAMLKDQMNQPQEALKFYQQAEKKHPKQPAVYNNLAVHYVRCGMVREAIEAAQRAVELRPREPRYRNNLAAILVEAGMPQEAFKQLREIYDEPVAHYDLGFLLNKRGMKAAALQEFTIALRLSPGMTLARQWVRAAFPGAWRGQPDDDRHDASAGTSSGDDCLEPFRAGREELRLLRWPRRRRSTSRHPSTFAAAVPRAAAAHLDPVSRSAHSATRSSAVSGSNAVSGPVAESVAKCWAAKCGAAIRRGTAISESGPCLAAGCQPDAGRGLA